MSQGIPQGAFQGLYLEVGAAVDAYTSQYLPRYNQIINTDAPMTINATLLGSEGEYTLNANIGLEENFDNSGVKVVFILARHISDEYFSSVIAYDYSTDFNLSSSGSTGMFEKTFSVNSSWDPETIKGYVLVQSWNTTSPEIYQAAEAGSAAVSMTDASWGEAYIGSEFTKTFVVANIGSSATDITITMDAPGFELSGEMNYSLAPGQTQAHNITFIPTADQVYSGFINIQTTIPGFENNTITLSGTGFTNAAPVIENLSFDGVLMKNSSIEVLYDFVDSDGDDEGDSIYQWYISDDGENWSDFTNINADIFTIHFAVEHIGKYFKFTILPYDEHLMPGEEVVVQTTQAVIDLAPPANLAYTVENGNNIVLTWEPPVLPLVRGLFGYKVLRGSTFIATITDTDVLTYTDENVEDGTYTYIVKGIYSPGGLSTDSNMLNITIVNGVSNENDVEESNISINNYPNPFSVYNSFVFNTKREEHIKIDVYNIKGQFINTIADRPFSQGEQSVVWDGKDLNGNKCSSGVYFYKVITPEKTLTSKVILMK